ncbi:MAG: hypothetical protein ABSB22_04660 [Thermodesulfobacteriota bacterium]|jgi:hypothetical protein
MMSLRYGVLSLFALFAILLLVLENYETWTLPVQVFPEKGATKKSVRKTESPPTVVGQKEPPDIQSYIFISQNNVFSPERKEFPIIPLPSSVPPPIVRPLIILYGVTIAGDYQSASIVNPGKPRMKGEREMINVKVGDQIGGFKVAKILPDRIVMEGPADSFEILLYDPRTPKQRTYAKTEVQPTTITSTLPTPPPLTTAAAPTPMTPMGATAKPGESISGGVLEAPVPRPITSTPIPSARSRRFYGPRPPGED